MSLSVRRSTPPRRLMLWAAAWAVVGMAVLVAPGGAGGHPVGRPADPDPVPAALAGLPAGATDVRVAGWYGSEQAGSWQFTGFLVWRSADGRWAGGSVELPVLAGQPPLSTALTQPQLAAQAGWGLPVARFSALLGRLTDRSAALGLVDYSPTAGDQSTPLTVCRAAGSGARQVAVCLVMDTGGRVHQRYTDRLVVQPLCQALAVQRQRAYLACL